MADPFHADGIVSSAAVLVEGLNVQAAVGGYRHTYFVDPINGSDSNNGSSWSQAFLSAQAAVDQFESDKHDDYVGSALSPAAEIYGMNGLIMLGAGDHIPADDTSPIIELHSWSADGATAGGNWGLTIMGVPGNNRAILMGGATNTANLIHIAGARGIRILNLSFHRALQTATTADIFLTDGDEVVNKTAAAASHHSLYCEIAGCDFLEDMAADSESSPAAIHTKSGKHLLIHHNRFGNRSTARGIIYQNDNGNPGWIHINDNYFAPCDLGAIQYVAAASAQDVEIFNNRFRRDGRTIAGAALTMANAIDIPAGKAVEYQPLINNNLFMGWAALDNAGATDAIYDAQGTAVVDAGTDYMGNDTYNALSS